MYGSQYVRQSMRWLLYDCDFRRDLGRRQSINWQSVPIFSKIWAYELRTETVSSCSFHAFHGLPNLGLSSAYCHDISGLARLLSLPFMPPPSTAISDISLFQLLTRRRVLLRCQSFRNIIRHATKSGDQCSLAVPVRLTYCASLSGPPKRRQWMKPKPSRRLGRLQVLEYRIRYTAP